LCEPFLVKAEPAEVSDVNFWKRRAEAAELEVVRLTRLNEENNMIIALREDDVDDDDSCSAEEPTPTKRPRVDPIFTANINLAAPPDGKYYPPIFIFMRDMVLQEFQGEEKIRVLQSAFRESYNVWAEVHGHGKYNKHECTTMLIAALPSFRKLYDERKHWFTFIRSAVTAFFEGPSPFTREHEEARLLTPCISTDVLSVRNHIVDVWIGNKMIFDYHYGRQLHEKYMWWCIQKNVKNAARLRKFVNEMTRLLPTALIITRNSQRALSAYSFNYERAIADLAGNTTQSVAQ
jgi:hypothetical protein